MGVGQTICLSSVLEVLHGDVNAIEDVMLTIHEFDACRLIHMNCKNVVIVIMCSRG